MHLSQFATHSDVEIVMDGLGADNHIHHVETSVYASCHASGDNAIGMKRTNQFAGAYGSIHFSNAALTKHNVFVFQLSNDIVELVFYAFLICEERGNLFKSIVMELE